MVYRIWCKEVDGPGATGANTEKAKGLAVMDMGSAMDWHDVEGTIIQVNGPNALGIVQNTDTLRIFKHGSIDTVGQMTAKQLAHYLYDHGLRQVEKIELVACCTATEKWFTNSYAQRLLEHLVNDSNKSVAITRTQGALGDLAPDRHGAYQDAITLPDQTTVYGDAGKKSYERQAACYGMKTVST